MSHAERRKGREKERGIVPRVKWEKSISNSILMPDFKGRKKGQSDKLNLDAVWISKPKWICEYSDMVIITIFLDIIFCVLSEMCVQHLY